MLLVVKRELESRLWVVDHYEDYEWKDEWVESHIFEDAATLLNFLFENNEANIQFARESYWDT